MKEKSTNEKEPKRCKTASSTEDCSAHTSTEPKMPDERIMKRSADPTPAERPDVADRQTTKAFPTSSGAPLQGGQDEAWKWA